MLSEPYMIILFVISCIITLTGTEFTGLLGFAAIILFTLIICYELIATTLPFLLMCCFMIKCFDSFSTYIKIVWLAPFCAAIIISHFFIYPKPIKAGFGLYAQLAVTAAVMLGGVGTISAKEYFSLMSIYYMLGLGIGMVLIYLISYSYFESTEKVDVHRYFAKIMFIVYLYSVFVVLSYYIINIKTVMETRSILEPQWRNNISTFIMLTMPFAFYLSLKKSPCLIAALLSMPCLLLTSSRGGLLFGGCEFVLCCIYLLYADKKHRTRNFTILAVCAMGVIALSGDIVVFISKTLSRFETINDEPRAKLIQRALEDFRSNLPFGRGIGYLGNRDIHPSKKFAACWYHSSPFQIIGSFGCAGVIAFVFQFITRNRIFWSRVSYFTLATYISYAGILMMSLVNPGEFCPLPYELLVVMMFAIIERSCPVNHERTLIGKSFEIKTEEEK